jgi:CBS-domain-containing membrane protein
MIGGYLIGMTAGSLCHLLTLIPEPTGWPVDRPILVASAAMAAGLTIFIMTVTETEHPPAASFAVGLALEWSWLTAVVAMAGIVLLVLIKELIKPRLCNLVDVADPEEQPPECPHSE